MHCVSSEPLKAVLKVIQERSHCREGFLSMEVHTVGV
jgi:hypothetical protein